MHDWDPALYQRFESERTRPAVELLARVSHPAPRHIVDLGCGNGNSTQLLLERFPQSQLIGLDNSEAMLVSARKRLPGVPFVQADIADWAPTVAPDLIFANASLQWVAGHAGLFARLMRCLAPGGVLAVQMPDNLDQPSHQLMRELASQSAWRDQLAHAADQRAALLSVADIPMFSVGLVFSFISAWLCVRWLLRYISSHSFVPFAYYRIVFGVLVLVTAGMGWVTWAD